MKTITITLKIIKSNLIRVQTKRLSNTNVKVLAANKKKMAAFDAIFLARNIYSVIQATINEQLGKWNNVTYIASLPVTI